MPPKSTSKAREKLRKKRERQRAEAEKAKKFSRRTEAELVTNGALDPPADAADAEALMAELKGKDKRAAGDNTGNAMMSLGDAVLEEFREDDNASEEETESGGSPEADRQPGPPDPDVHDPDPEPDVGEGAPEATWTTSITGSIIQGAIGTLQELYETSFWDEEADEELAATINLVYQSLRLLRVQLDRRRAGGGEE